MRILLADDNYEVRSALRLLLEQEPMQINVLEVSSMQDLCNCLRGSCPKVILLDWELPGLHTSNFMTMLRSHYPEIKVIALSSKFEARQEALAAQVDAFVSKAEPPEQILYTLYSLFPNLQNQQH